MGTALSSKLRHDIHAKYAKFIGEIGMFANKEQKLMIERGWFEEPPLSVVREKAVKHPLQ